MVTGVKKKQTSNSGVWDRLQSGYCGCGIGVLFELVGNFHRYGVRGSVGKTPDYSLEPVSNIGTINHIGFVTVRDCTHRSLNQSFRITCYFSSQSSTMAPQLEYVFTLHVDLEPPLDYGPTSTGYKRFIPEAPGKYTCTYRRRLERCA